MGQGPDAGCRRAHRRFSAGFAETWPTLSVEVRRDVAGAVTHKRARLSGQDGGDPAAMGRPRDDHLRQARQGAPPADRLMAWLLQNLRWPEGRGQTQQVDAARRCPFELHMTTERSSALKTTPGACVPRPTRRALLAGDAVAAARVLASVVPVQQLSDVDAVWRGGRYAQPSTARPSGPGRTTSTPWNSSSRSALRPEMRLMTKSPCCMT